MISYPYYKKLHMMRNFLEEEYGSFPSDHYHIATKFVAKTLGLQEVAGYYLSGSTKEWHAWIHDPIFNYFIDLTMDQFSSLNKKISIVPLNHPKLEYCPHQTKVQKNFKEFFSERDLDDLIKKYEAYEERANL